MVPAAAPKRAASLCLALLPLAAGHAHPHAHDHALLLLGEGQPLVGLQSELFAPWRSDACHDPTEWCWTGADGAASVDLGDGRWRTRSCCRARRPMRTAMWCEKVN